MKLYLVILLAILSTAFAGKQRSQKCKNRTRDLSKVFSFTVNPPIVNSWRPRSFTLNTDADDPESRVVSFEARNCEFVGSPLARLVGVAGTVSNPVPIETAVPVTVGAISNTIRVNSNGVGCGALCYLISTCTHYNYNAITETCSLFSSKNGVTHYSAIVSSGSNNLCGLKVASSTVNAPNLFRRNTPNDNSDDETPIGDITRRNDCIFTELPSFIEQDVNNEIDCATSCEELGDSCNAYEYYANTKTCIYKKNSRTIDAVLSTLGFLPGGRNKILRCGSKL